MAAQFRIKIQGKLYEVDKLTLGEGRTLRQHFDVRDMSDMHPGDPLVIAGLAYICLARENPSLPHTTIMAMVDSLTFDDFEEAPELEPDPTPGADATALKRRAKTGS